MCHCADEIDAQPRRRICTRRARPGRHEHCEISERLATFAQVSWGKAFGGNDARSKVIFEHASGSWIEILRYEAPTPTPARNRTKRSKSRTLWARRSARPAHRQVRRRDAAFQHVGIEAALGQNERRGG